MQCIFTIISKYLPFLHIGHKLSQSCIASTSCQQRYFASKKRSGKKGKQGKEDSSNSSSSEEEEEEEADDQEKHSGIKERSKKKTKMKKKEVQGDPKFDLSKLEVKTTSVLEKLKKGYSTMRLGRASPAILDPVNVAHKGGQSPLKDIAQVIVKDPQTLMINVHDEELLGAVQKAILGANLNLNPVLDGKGLKVLIPKITSEYREEMIKIASKNAEYSKIHMRNIRQEEMKSLRQDLRNASSDEIVRHEKKKTALFGNTNHVECFHKLQTVIEKAVKDIDEILKAKTKEILGN
ncbi:hypothetical protein G9A89_022442 [Geosiphon pyriformis]|nr:hypothetical protein G9A89_022442 [Geosiphon pyriformis]